MAVVRQRGALHQRPRLPLPSGDTGWRIPRLDGRRTLAVARGAGDGGACEGAMSRVPVPPRDEMMTEHNITELPFGFDLTVSFRDVDHRTTPSRSQLRTGQELLAWLHLSRVLNAKGVD